MAVLSVRTGFDLLLRTLNLPHGTRVLMTSVTIRDMYKIVVAHGLVPVPVDLDPDTLAPKPGALQVSVWDLNCAKHF